MHVHRYFNKIWLTNMNFILCPTINLDITEGTFCRSSAPSERLSSCSLCSEWPTSSSSSIQRYINIHPKNIALKIAKKRVFSGLFSLTPFDCRPWTSLSTNTSTCWSTRCSSPPRWPRLTSDVWRLTSDSLKKEFVRNLSNLQMKIVASLCFF